MNANQMGTLLEGVRDDVRQIAEAQQLFSERVDRRFDTVDARFEHVDHELLAVRGELAEVKQDVSVLKTDMREVKHDLAYVKRNTALLGIIGGDHEDRLQALER